MEAQQTSLASAEPTGRGVVVSGNWLKIATVRDEELVEGTVVPNPTSFVRQLKQSDVAADVFTFPQNIGETEQRYEYPFEWDNAAVAQTSDYAAWWEKLPQETRKNVRRAAKKGVTVRAVAFDDDFVAGIKAIYDETPIRQGGRFPHYQKDFDVVREENGTYRERCEYLGAYYEGRLIGFMRFVYVDRMAKIMQILASVAHTDKRPMNALIAKAVEICHEKGMSGLVYSRFRFGNKKESALAEFKRRNGFEEVLFPRYFLPLTLKGRMAVKLKLHRGLLGLLPSGVIAQFLRVRGKVLRLVSHTGRGRDAAHVAQTRPV
jgi:hypothetical protein